MKRSLVLISFIFLTVAFAGAVYSALNAATDLALGAKAVGTFGNLASATDGIISVNKAVPATSNVVAGGDQFLTVDLGGLVYVDRVKVYFDSAAYPRAFSVRTSDTAKYWQIEAAGLDAADGAKDNKSGTIAVSISCKRALIGARYVQIQIPAGTLVAGADRVRISEVEIFPAIGQKLSILDNNAYAVTDGNAVISYSTNIGCISGRIRYGTSPTALTSVAPNQESGVNNSATIYGLKPGTVYYYRVVATDLYGNNVESAVGIFQTLGVNVAKGKPVSGTFTALPADPFVDTTKPALARVTDSSTSYFTAMAQSLSLNASDQYVVIDLGQDYPIKNIQTYWRRLAYPESYSILVSKDNASWTTLASNLNAGDGAFSRSDTGDPMQIVATPAGDVSARYVKVFIKKDSPFFHKHFDWDFVQLMEVKVFSD